MSYFGRNLKNKFPLWSKIRKDAASFGGSIMDAIGKELEEERLSFYQNVNSYRCLEGEPLVEPDILYVFNLNQNDSYMEYINNNKEVTAFDCTGTIGSESITIESVDSYELLCRKYGNRFSKEFIESKAALIVTLGETININNSVYSFKEDYTKVYLEISDDSTFDTESTNPLLDGPAYIKICGIGEDDEECEEEIIINDCGLYESKYFYKQIKPLVRRENIRGGGGIERYGFKGEVNIYRKAINIKEIVHPFQTLVKVTDDLNRTGSLIENDARFKLIDKTISGATKSYIQFKMAAMGSGKEYRIEDQLADKELFLNVLTEKALVNLNDEQVKISNFTLDKVRNKLIGVDLGLNIYVFPIGKTNFLPKKINRTREVDFFIEVENQFATLGETKNINFYLERPKSDVEKFFIGRHTPDRGELYTDETFGFDFEFLQSDLTWSDDFYCFKKGQELVDSFSAQNEFSELGQYDFYIFHITKPINGRDIIKAFETNVIDEDSFKNELLAYSKLKDNKGLRINSYSIVCDYVKAEKVIALETILNENERIIADITTKEGGVPTIVSVSPFFKGVNNNLFLYIETTENNYTYKIKEHKDFIIFDYPTGNAALLETYDSVDITINNSFSETINYD